MQNNLMKMEDKFYEENEINIYDLINIPITLTIIKILIFFRKILTNLYISTSSSSK